MKLSLIHTVCGNFLKKHDKLKANGLSSQRRLGSSISLLRPDNSFTVISA